MKVKLSSENKKINSWETSPLFRLQMRFNIERLKEDFLTLLHTRGYDHFSQKNNRLYKAYLKNKKFYDKGFEHISLTEYRENLKSTPFFWKNEKNINKPCSDLPSYTRSVLDQFSPYFHRCRFSSLAPNSHVKLHRDYSIKYSYRIHIPVITNKEARFFFKQESQTLFKHLPADGFAWFFNQSIPHGAENSGKNNRIHLIVVVKSTFPMDDFI